MSQLFSTLPGDAPQSTPSINDVLQENDTCKLVLTEVSPGQIFLVASVVQGANGAAAARAVYGEIAGILRDRSLTVVHERLFGSLTVKATVLAIRAEQFLAHNLPAASPLTYIQGHPPWGEGFAGAIIQGVSCLPPEDKVRTIRDQGQPVGRSWRWGKATFLLLQNLQGLSFNGDGANSYRLQTQRMIRQAARLLEAQGASYRDVVRTWFYLSDILAWYPEFNQARTAIYRQFGILPGQGNGCLRLPASTGILGDAPGGAACTMDLLAVQTSEQSNPLVRPLRNPKQQDAYRYGSAFSRGALINLPDVSLIQVSGTAAIDELGRSLHPGNTRAQIDCTFDKVAALIGQEGASLTDIAAACVFVKRPEDALVYYEQAAAHGLENLPAVVMVAAVCRPELLFEIDAEVAFNPHA